MTVGTDRGEANDEGQKDLVGARERVLASDPPAHRGSRVAAAAGPAALRRVALAVLQRGVGTSDPPPPAVVAAQAVTTGQPREATAGVVDETSDRPSEAIGAGAVVRIGRLVVVTVVVGPVEVAPERPVGAVAALQALVPRVSVEAERMGVPRAAPTSDARRAADPVIARHHAVVMIGPGPGGIAGEAMGRPTVVRRAVLRPGRTTEAALGVHAIATAVRGVESVPVRGLRTRAAVATTALQGTVPVPGLLVDDRTLVGPGRTPTDPVLVRDHRGRTSSEGAVVRIVPHRRGVTEARLARDPRTPPATRGRPAQVGGRRRAEVADRRMTVAAVPGVHAPLVTARGIVVRARIAGRAVATAHAGRARTEGRAVATAHAGVAMQRLALSGSYGLRKSRDRRSRAMSATSVRHRPRVSDRGSTSRPPPRWTAMTSLAASRQS
jgi:hypothetical protein